MKITCKQQMYDLYEKGLLGNRPRIWKNLDELMADTSYDGKVSIRYKDPAFQYKKYYVPKAQVPEVIAAIPAVVNHKLFTFNESMPDDKLVLQGEVGYTPFGFELFYNTEKNIAMRDAMLRGKRATMLEARIRLQTAMDPSSYDDLWALLDTYEDAAVEFSTYSIDVGVYPHRNTVFWEVRNY